MAHPPLAHVHTRTLSKTSKYVKKKKKNGELLLWKKELAMEFHSVNKVWLYELPNGGIWSLPQSSPEIVLFFTSTRNKANSKDSGKYDGKTREAVSSRMR